MLATILAGVTEGVRGILVSVEVDVSGRGFPTFTIVGLPGKAVDEAKERVRTAITNAGYEMPDSRLTVNLAPADVPKGGSAFDLAIAIGILVAIGAVPQAASAGAMFLGELSLEGGLRRINGGIPLVLLATESGIDTVYLPPENAAEASLVGGVRMIPVSSLRDIVSHLRDEVRLPVHVDHALRDAADTDDAFHTHDFAHIHGQTQAKRVMEIAAAGFHNVHLRGSPGAGKTMLARSLPTIIPRMAREEMLEVAKIYSIIGDLNHGVLKGVRPFRCPHHTTSRVGLIGGGSVPAPGEISLAHRGVLFLDEFPEYPRHVLEAMRQPLEDGIVTVSRAAGTLTFPARFLLLAASNPCPCGFRGHPKHVCTCPPGTIERYGKRISGPILDRIDLHIDVPPVEVARLGSGDSHAESSAAIRARVARAHAQQRQRFLAAGVPTIQFNSEMTSSHVRTYTEMTPRAKDLLAQAVDKLGLSARSYFKVAKVSRTIADLDGAEVVSEGHVGEALQYRPK